eukprot:scaffold22908_cov53-Cyclotella_meneghiniana.AAC.4
MPSPELSHLPRASCVIGTMFGLYSMGGLIERIPSDRCDICVLEEPEHLNWYRAPGENWTSKFKLVVGIVHTNYFVYAREQPVALLGTLRNFAPEKELVENVHGVRRTYLNIGEELKCRLFNDDNKSSLVPVPSADATPKCIYNNQLASKSFKSKTLRCDKITR